MIEHYLIIWLWVWGGQLCWHYIGKDGKVIGYIVVVLLWPFVFPALYFMDAYDDYKDRRAS